MNFMTPMNFVSAKTLHEIRKSAGEFDHVEEEQNVDLYMITMRYIYEIEHRTFRTIDAAKNTDLDPLDENDLKAIILSHATRIMGISVDAQRSNDLDDLILVNLIC